MKWFRFHLGAGAALALCALALQMAVSFGHFHRQDLGLQGLGVLSPTSVQVKALAGTAYTQTASQPFEQQTAPDDLCAICIAVSFMSSAALASAPAVAAPAFAQAASIDTPAPFISVWVFCSFHARAPPIV